MRNDSGWTDLIVETGATPVPLDDSRFREWMNRQRIFVSSVMDEEMRPAREAVRGWIRQWGGTPEMWEEFAPRDQRPEEAYLDGVERSQTYLLLAGSSYGVADQTGFSPTHKEGNRARELGRTRLLWEKADISHSERDGKLNRWIQSEYSNLSGGKYHSNEQLVQRVESQLRGLAAQQESSWIKVGQLVFPGRVSRRRTGNSTELTVSARVRDGAVRRAIGQLGHLSSIRANRLTWPNESHPVQVTGVTTETSYTTEDVATITCAFPQQYFGGNSAAPMQVSYGANGGPERQAELWARHALFGAPAPDRRQHSSDMLLMMSLPQGPTLPQVLQEYQAREWLAEGLARLYIIEELIARHGGHFERLEVGPATATTIPIHARFVPGGHSSTPVDLAGSVPLP